MASEYLKWKYRNVRPEEKRELTAKEKRRNWWHYHWRPLLLVLAAAVILGRIAYDQFTRVKPDCSVALVTRCQPTGRELSSLQAELERWSPDSNGDGTVLVEVNAIQIDYDSTDMSPEALKVMEANIDKLNFDFYTRQSGIVLLEDPASFQANHQALAFLDGSTPPEGSVDWESMVRPWTDWAGSGAVERESGLPERLWFGRRITTSEKDEAAFVGANALWDALFP